MAEGVKEFLYQFIKQKIPAFSPQVKQYQGIVEGVDCYIQANELNRFEKYRHKEPRRFEMLLNLELTLFESMTPHLLQTYFEGYCQRMKVEQISHEALRLASIRREQGILIDRRQYSDLLNRFYAATTELSGESNHQSWLDEITELTVADLKYAYGLDANPSERLLPEGGRDSPK